VIPRELRTERLVLRQWRPVDVEPLADIYAQPEFLEHMPALDRAQTDTQVRRFVGQWEHEGFSHWAVEDPATGRLIGRIGLLRHHDWPVEVSPVEVGWTLDAAYWGHGLATEGARAAVRCWLDLLEDERLISITTPTNMRSRAVMERLGMTLRGSAYWHGHDVIWYALDRSAGES
jgi:RimJ/RimL family protein N-acetyltransferase